MKELLAKPGFLGTYGTLGADFSYLLSLFFTTIFLYSWYAAKKGKGTRHHNFILWGMASMLIYFSAYYVVRRLATIAIEGREGFGGPDWVYMQVFTPLLIVHILLVIFGIITALYMIYLGFKTSIKEEGNYKLIEGERIGDRNKRLKMFLGTIFLIGLIGYLRCSIPDCWIFYSVLAFMVTLFFALQTLIEHFLPDGAQRHRILGKITMSLFVAIPVTSTFIYLILYVLYEPKFLS
ncbi:MAG: DUF420 domain-containing protein [Nitrospinae bacterium]|nr:DUF420 domain-containing protein [Nitrospinota bacterium]